MKICHICSNYDKFFVNLMEQQISMGLDIRVYYFRAKERGMPDVSAPYLDVRLNYSNWLRFFFYLKEKPILKDFFYLYKGMRFDLIHAHTLFSNGYIALQAKERWGVPYIVAVRDTDINVFFKYRINLRKLGVKILKEADKIIFLSESYRQHTLQTYVPRKLRDEFYKKSHVVPNGVDSFYLDNKYKRLSNIHDLRKTLNILTVGYISKRKNQLTVCNAVKHLNDMGIKTNYIIVGKVLDKKIMEKVKRFPFVKYIPFLDKSDLIKEYRKADIFVMPSLTETFGLTYVEAMSQGLPIIYSKNQGFDGQFPEGMVGYHVDSMNSQEIVNRILDIINNYNIISENCTNLCDKFNWKKISDEYKKLYEYVLE